MFNIGFILNNNEYILWLINTDFIYAQNSSQSGFLWKKIFCYSFWLNLHPPGVLQNKHITKF